MSARAAARLEPIRQADTVAFRTPRRTGACGSTATHPSWYAHAFDYLLEQRWRAIAEVAYFKAERRGFVPGFQLQDWLEAEQEVDAAARPLPGV
jgi:hypothetical protein